MAVLYSSYKRVEGCKPHTPKFKTCKLKIPAMWMQFRFSIRRTSSTLIAWKASFPCPALCYLSASIPSNRCNWISDSTCRCISRRLLASMIGHGGRERGGFLLACDLCKTSGCESRGQRKHSMILRRRDIWNHFGF